MKSQSFGFVRLDSCMADDISVVNSARVSFAKSQQEMDDSGRGLINFLMREKHGTPFEHNSFRFHVKCPVFVAREWFRHRIGSFNEFSARYSEVGEDFFVPYQNDVRSQVGKPGAYEFHIVEEDIANQAIEIINQANISAYEAYKKLIDMGIAKELSRTVLPVGMYTQFYWTVNARSLMNFLSLRLSKTAQLDIRRYAKSVEAIFADKMPVTYKAWVENGMNCP
jgi:thymidylate synthase (FAD)